MPYASHLTRWHASRTLSICCVCMYILSTYWNRLELALNWLPVSDLTEILFTKCLWKENSIRKSVLAVHKCPTVFNGTFKCSASCCLKKKWDASILKQNRFPFLGSSQRMETSTVKSTQRPVPDHWFSQPTATQKLGYRELTLSDRARSLWNRRRHTHIHIIRAFKRCGFLKWAFINATKMNRKDPQKSG